MGDGSVRQEPTESNRTVHGVKHSEACESLYCPESWGQLVRRVAAEFDHEPTDRDIDHILWEHTGYPGFWQGDPATECARQVRAFYQHRSEGDR